MRGDEQQILDVLAERLESGRADYGVWRVDHTDPRDYGEEAWQEVIDCLLYCAAQIVRLRGGE